jgi:hypothetical protein
MDASRALNKWFYFRILIFGVLKITDFLIYLCRVHVDHTAATDSGGRGLL